MKMESERKEMNTFYWYPRCSTCRKAKAMLDNRGVAYTTVDLKATPPHAEQFEIWFAQGNFPVKKFFNTSGQVYRELGLKDHLTELSNSEKANLLASNGMLIKRPLFVRDGKLLAIGFEAETYEKL